VIFVILNFTSGGRRRGACQPAPASAAGAVDGGRGVRRLGSVARGFAAAGFQVAYLNDIDPVARATYCANDGPGGVYELRDVRSVTVAVSCTLLTAAGRRPAGLPPCQGWSAAGHRAAVDRRNELLKDFFRLVNSVYPVFFVMKNVPSVADRQELATALATPRNRYRLWQGVLNAVAYGLPQSRQRVLVIRYRQKDSGHGYSERAMSSAARKDPSPRWGQN
jgi:DNA (cytosine-5)-methyltransferase 1